MLHTACAEAAAPPGFRIHFDFNGDALHSRLPRTVAAVLPTATGHAITQMEQYEEDVLSEPIRVSEGCARVPEAPGLGVEVDEEALQETGTEEGAIRGIGFELWQEDGSEEFRRVWERLEREGRSPRSGRGRRAPEAADVAVPALPG